VRVRYAPAPVKLSRSQTAAPPATAATTPVDATLTGERVTPTPATDRGDDPSHALASSQIRDPARYAIIAEHGRGGLGRVSRAHDRELGRDVAIKELISRRPLSELRFLREALITARLEHPGIVAVHEAGRWPDGTPFYAMKLVAGRPLRALLDERTTVGARTALLHHVIAVADAMAYAHGCHIIHRDLKPANVIVGDFGETVVIDWGLAKDLRAPGEADDDGDPHAVALEGDLLTSTGNVLGTPAYMAPEQARGERVDQRADVYAIGAMLWELCALHKAPPADRALRLRTLRHAGVDPDLITILDKALATDPARRYRDAGALAADLKAFTAGARIAARTYSLPAMLAHWARRHRPLAIAIVAALAVAATGGALYVRGVAIARDRAEAAQHRIELERAELLVHRDPSAAFDRLRGYRGDDTRQLAMLRAHAVGLGLATVRAQPHTQSVYLIRPLADGTLLTLGADGKVAKTARDGTSRVIARGVAPQYTFAYAERRHLLAYACTATGICVLDVERETLRAPPTGQPSLAPTCLAFSPDEAQLAAISPRGEVSVWQFPDDAPAVATYSVKLEDGDAIRFADDRTLMLDTAHRVQVVHLPAAPGAPAIDGPSLDGSGHTTSSTALHLIAVATGDGELLAIDSASHAERLRAQVCKGYVNRLLVLSVRAAVAYGCQDGDVGVIALAGGAPRVLAHLDGGAATLATSDDDRYLIAGGTDGTLAIFDAATGAVTTRLGHAARVGALLAPSPGFPYVASGDESGNLRTWPLPAADLRVVATTASRLAHATPLAGGGPIVAVGFDDEIAWTARDGRTGALPDHSAARSLITASAARSRFALFGTDEGIEVWTFTPAAAAMWDRQTWRSRHGAVTAAAFTARDQLIAGHRDGSLALWPAGTADAPRDLGTIREPIEQVRALPGREAAVIAGASGALWLADEAGVHEIAREPEPITSIACAPDARWLAVGTGRGHVQLYDVVSHAHHTAWSAPSWIEQVVFSPDGARLAISTNGRVHLVELAGDARASRWRGLELEARFAAFSPDGAWLAAAGDRGELWLYRAADDRWRYLATGGAQLSQAVFSADSAQLVATDPGGRAIAIDMTAIAAP
jgi:WD40 repeat protein